MKKYIIALLITVSTLSAFSQAPELSKLAINDFAQRSWVKYKFGDGVFRVRMNQILIAKGYSAAGAAVVMENISKDAKGREIVFAGIADMCGDRTSLFNTLYSMDMDANNANELSNYLYIKYNKEKLEGK